ncbi:MAG: hypothetical protein JOZ08_12775, partial [Verrucomicrobia bacterium]|nr:hypothetical protein [Verrucomicrobiota bacterium]
MPPLNNHQKSRFLSEERTSRQRSLRIDWKEHRVPRIPITLAALFAIALLPAFGAGNGYNGGQPTNPKDLKGKKIVLADVPKLVGIGYFAATTKGQAEAAAELTKNGL